MPLAEICTSALCTAGKASVDQMQIVFEQLSQPYEFAAAVDAIQKSFNDNYSFYSPWIPFNPTCCTVADIGRQADALVQQMQQKYGQVSTTPGPSTIPPQPDALSNLVLLAAIIAGVILIPPLLKKK